MRPSTPHPALVNVLLAAIVAVLFADILAVSAAADPLPAGTGAVLSPISPSNISRPLLSQLVSPLKPTARRDRPADPGCPREHPATTHRQQPNTARRGGWR